MRDYQEFIGNKTHLAGNYGFNPVAMPDFLFPFQQSLVEWAIKKGRAAILADCGLGKTPMQLAWSDNVFRKEGKPVLVLTPLSVSIQTVSEAHKFGFDAARSSDGSVAAPITVTNYERLHHFNPSDFSGVVCDESSILKNFDGALKAQITEFMRKLKYRLLCTATAAPNDYIELGTSSEALGELGYMDMLAMFFKNAQNSLHPSVYRQRGQDFARLDEGAKWRFRGHAERDFWRWVCSWARAVRKPSDLGFSDDGFTLPKLVTCEHIVKAAKARTDMLFDLPAIGLKEQREERRRTIEERCELAASLVSDTGAPAVMWCHLNDEGDALEKAVSGAVQISGKDSDERKEEVFESFASGQIRVLVSKPVIACFGLNWQHCSHQTFFPSHSFEQWYQAIRRCWRYGQKNAVRVDVISSEGEAGVLNNLNRKAFAAQEMFSQLVSLMSNELKIEKKQTKNTKAKLPQWLS